MTQRVIKFRIIHDNKINGYERLTPDGWEWMALDMNPEGRENWYRGVFPYGYDYKRNQFSGLTDKHKNEIYEGDIRKEMFDGIFNGDPQREHYFVMVYIQEWTMFAWLSINSGEYHEYLNDGAEALDTEMYWTYPAGQDEPNKIELVGNIYTTPELVDPKMIEHGNS